MAQLPLSDPQSREPITHDTILVVEGRDAFGFFLGLLTELGLHQRIEIRNAGGVNDWPDYLLALTGVSGFNHVTSMGLVRDSETAPRTAFADVRRALKNAGLPIPAAPGQGTPAPPHPHISIALLPDANTAGMLETLCWQALQGDARVPCVEEFVTCVVTNTSQALSISRKVQDPCLYCST